MVENDVWGAYVVYISKYSQEYAYVLNYGNGALARLNTRC